MRGREREKERERGRQCRVEAVQGRNTKGWRGVVKVRRRDCDCGIERGSVGNRVVISQAVVPPRSVDSVVFFPLLTVGRSNHLRRSFPAAFVAPLSVPGGVVCRVPCRAAIYLILSPVNSTKVSRRMDSEDARLIDDPAARKSMTSLRAVVAVTMSTDKLRRRGNGAAASFSLSILIYVIGHLGN